MSYANIIVRQINNGFIVGGTPTVLNCGGDSGETYFATEDDLRAALPDLVMRALAVAAAEQARMATEREQEFAQQREYARRSAFVGNIGGATLGAIRNRIG